MRILHQLQSSANSIIQQSAFLIPKVNCATHTHCWLLQPVIRTMYTQLVLQGPDFIWVDNSDISGPMLRIVFPSLKMVMEDNTHLIRRTMRTLKAGHPLNSKSVNKEEYISDNTACCIFAFMWFQVSLLSSQIGFVRSNYRSLPFASQIGFLRSSCISLPFTIICNAGEVMRALSACYFDIHEPDMIELKHQLRMAGLSIERKLTWFAKR